MMEQWLRAAPLMLTLTACADALEREVVDAPAVELVEELRLDANAEDFSVVGRIWVGPRREIVVPLPQDRQIWIYDSAGTRIAEVGRAGSGPGEFRSLGSIGWIADTLWVVDGVQRRITFIAPDGAVLRTESFPATATRGAPVTGSTKKIGFFAAIAVLGDGSLFGEAQLDTDPDAANSGWPERTFVIIPPTTASDRSVGSPEASSSASLARIVARPPSYYDQRWLMEVEGFGQNVPFIAEPLVAHRNDGRGFAYLTTEFAEEGNGTYTITRFDGDGDTTLVRSYPFRGIPISAHVRDSTLAAFIPPPGSPREGPADLPQRFQAIARERMPDHYPPVMSMVLGLDQSIWLTMRDTASARRALILDGDGAPIGTFQLPPRATVRQATATHVWMTERDEVDLVSVVRYRVKH